MKNLLTISLTLFLFNCSGGDTVIVNTHGDRISELERRADLNDLLNEVQNTRLIALESRMVGVEQRASDLEASVASLESDVESLESVDVSLQSQIDDLTAQMLAGDSSLQSQINSLLAQQSVIQGQISSIQSQLFAQFWTNLLVQSQIASINNRFPLINSRLNSLQSQINSQSSRISDLESELNSVISDLSSLSLRVTGLESDYADLRSDLNALEDRLDREGVTVFKCNNPSSTEKIFKINGLFYAAMNYVTTKSVSIVTAGTPQSVTVPKLCSKSNGRIKTPDSSGNCTGSGWSVMPGTGVTTTIPSNSVSNVTVVSSVKIALESLNASSTYVTTDGGPACTFKGDGTNLVPFNL